MSNILATIEHSTCTIEIHTKTHIQDKIYLLMKNCYKCYCTNYKQLKLRIVTDCICSILLLYMFVDWLLLIYMLMILLGIFILLL